MLVCVRATLNEGVINECAARKLPLQHLFFAIAMYVKYVDKKTSPRVLHTRKGAVKKIRGHEPRFSNFALRFPRRKWRPCWMRRKTVLARSSPRFLAC
jgi:hypothetical protein